MEDGSQMDIQQLSPVEELPVPETPVLPAPDPVKRKKAVKTRIRKLYNSACLSLLFQFGISAPVSGMAIFVYSMVATAQRMFQNPGQDLDTIMGMVMEDVTSPSVLLLTTAIAYLIANLASYFIGNAMIKRHHRASIFGRIQMDPMDCLLAVLAVLGIQMVSVLVQSFIVLRTGMTGVDESTAAMVTISDDVFQNVVLIVYMVIIAAITEELLFRGLILKAFSIKSQTFALVASSMLFGVMHGNFNQMFNGFLLGMVIGYAAIKSKSILLPILLHMCANGHAMLLSVLEYALGPQIVVFEFLYILAMSAVGITALVFLLKRNGKPNEAVDGYPVLSTVEPLSELEDPRGLTWGTLVQSVAFWIFMVIYILTACSGLTAISR